MKEKLVILATLTLFTATVTANAQAPFIPPEIILFTDRSAYNLGDKVVIIGYAVDIDFKPVPNTNISILIFDPGNTLVFDNVVTTNQSGIFSITYTIPQDVTEGEFLIIAEEEQGEFSPGLSTFKVCSICKTEPKVVVVTTTLTGPTVTTTQITTVLTTIAATTQTVPTDGMTSYTDLLTIIFIIIVAALFAIVIIAIRKYG